MLEVSNLAVSYGPTRILEDVSFGVPAQAVVALLGGNGSGKTTILNALTGMLRPRAGAVTLNGEIISGRYAQIHDPKATFWEGFTSLPLELTRKADYKPRGSLPHHDEIAVDADSPGNRHQLYSTAANPDPADRGAYGNQFRWRKNAAIAHVRKAWQDNWNG